jgi:hypothetical protein
MAQIANFRASGRERTNRLIYRDFAPQDGLAWLSENRGVPGSSPGLAIQERAAKLRFCKWPRRRATPSIEPASTVYRRTLTNITGLLRCRVPRPYDAAGELATGLGTAREPSTFGQA